jgi:EmrB/QacA subfamily drug resistance transporter
MTETEPQSRAAVGLQEWLGLAVTLVATFMGWLNIFVVNVALPAIRADFGAGTTQAQLLITGYTLAYATTLVVGGRLGDARGRRRIFRLGVATFTAAALVCAAAPSLKLLITIRILQGAAAGLMLPQVLSLLRVTFPQPERRIALGLYSAAVSLATILGQVVGGALISADVGGSGWRAIFLANVPIGLVLVAVAGRALRESSSPAPDPPDLVGAAALALAVAGVIVPLSLTPSQGWSPLALSGLTAGVVALAAFYAHEKRLAACGRRPLVPPWIVRSRRLRSGLAVQLVYYSGNAGLILLLALYLQTGLRQSPLESGLQFLPLGAGLGAASLITAPLLGRFGPRVLVAGGALMSIGILAVIGALQLPASEQPVPLGSALMVSGFGQGLVAAPLIGVMLATANDDDPGVISGVLMTTASLSYGIGTAAFAALYAWRLGSDSASQPRQVTAFVTSALGLLALAILTTALSARLGAGAEQGLTLASGGTLTERAN